MSPPCLCPRKEGRGKHSQYAALQEPRPLHSTPQCRMQPQAGYHVHEEQREPAGRGCHGTSICSGHDSPGCSLFSGSEPRGLECLKTGRASVSASSATTGLPTCKEEWNLPSLMNAVISKWICVWSRLSAWSLSCCAVTAARVCRGTLWHLNFPQSHAPP